MTNKTQQEEEWKRGNPIFNEAAERCTQLVVDEIGVGEGVRRIKNLLSTEQGRLKKAKYDKAKREARKETIEECVGVLEDKKITRTEYPRTRKLGLVSLTERRVKSYNKALTTTIEKLKAKQI